MLIGGYGTERRILSFNVESHTFQVLSFQLNVGRYEARCVFIPNTNKIMITGGYRKDSTEILDYEDGSVTMASPMNSIRSHHGMGVVTINDEERLAVFGGFDGITDLGSFELYNNQTGKWGTTDIKLKEAKSMFGFLCVKLADVISHLNF